MRRHRAILPWCLPSVLYSVGGRRSLSVVQTKSPTRGGANSNQKSSRERSSSVNGRKSAHKNATKPNAIDATAPTTSNVHIVSKFNVSTCLSLLLLGGGQMARAVTLCIGFARLMSAHWGGAAAN